MSDVISTLIGLIGLAIIAAILAKQAAGGWLRGNSWGGAPVGVVVETRPRRHYQPAWSIEQICDRNMRAGYLVYGAW